MVLTPDGVCSDFLYRILVNIVSWETTGWYTVHSRLCHMHIVCIIHFTYCTDLDGCTIVETRRYTAGYTLTLKLHRQLNVREEFNFNTIVT